MQKQVARAGALVKPGAASKPVSTKSTALLVELELDLPFIAALRQDRGQIAVDLAVEP